MRELSFQSQCSNLSVVMLHRDKTCKRLSESIRGCGCALGLPWSKQRFVERRSALLNVIQHLQGWGSAAVARCLADAPIFVGECAAIAS